MRRHRPDDLTASDLVGSAAAESIYHSMRSLDKTATSMEERWGVDRLPTLVDAEMASRFGTAKAKLDAAIAANDADEVAKRAAVMQRGWQALDRAATAAGHKPVEPAAWIWRDDSGRPHAFVRDVAEAHAYGKAHPGVAVWTMSEVVRFAEAFNQKQREIVVDVKKAFPGAEIERVGPMVEDELPF